MSAASLILISLIYAVPAILIVDSTIVHGVLCGILAVGIAVTATSMQHGESRFLTAVAWRASALAVIPPLWMIVQILPLGAINLGHPIWEGAQQAFGYSIGSSISIDPGATLLALSRYLCALAVMLLTTAVAIDRTRAERVLLALVYATALVAVMVIALRLIGSTILTQLDSPGHSPATTCVLLGMMSVVGAAIRTFERYVTRHARAGLSSPALLRQAIACAATFALCVIALVLTFTVTLLFVALCGIALSVGIAAIRYFGLGAWSRAAIAATAVSIAVAFVAEKLALRAVDWTLVFANAGPLVAATQRILMDVPWPGSGAGTFAYLLEIYRDVAEPTSAWAPTAASAAAIELGRPMLWFVIVAVAIELLALLRGALSRGRDSSYPAAGAGSLLLLLLFAFCDSGMLRTPNDIFAAAIVGLALAQSKSRTLA